MAMFLNSIRPKNVPSTTKTESTVLKNLSTLPNDVQIIVEQHPLSSNTTNYYAGLALHFLNKIRHTVKGYTSARGFKFEDLDRVVQYDFRVVKRWLDYLNVYDSNALALENKNILELGPGADLGIGLIFLASGANSYHALDVHNLVKGTPNAFYDFLFSKLEHDPNRKAEIDFLKEQLHLTQMQQNDRLNYLFNPDFDLSVFNNEKIDLVVSNSAFQQFDNPAKTIEQLNEIVNPGAYFIALLDLKTHTRWINQRDPLNIYRYPDTVYQQLRFRGAQNRIRPIDFKKILEANNWKNVKIIPRIQLESTYLEKVNPSLHERFQSLENQMEILTCLICAQKG